MAVLKYKDSNGQFVEVVGIMGPQGPKGDKGNKGDKGDAGGIQDVKASTNEGYITVVQANGTSKEIQVGTSGDFLPLTGGTVTGATTIAGTKIFKDSVTSGTTAGSRSAVVIYGTSYGNEPAYTKVDGKLSFGDPGPQLIFSAGTDLTSTNQPLALIYSNHNDIHNGNSLSLVSTETDCAFIAPKVYGAVWNDYAEYRETTPTEPGRVVFEKGDDTLSEANERMIPACSIVSDTFGFAIGQTKTCKTPLAVSGRVLAYPLEDRNSYKPGDAVCSGPNGTVSKMTQEEKINHPECIIGYVSCVPTYDTWGEKDTKVNGRIWVKVV